MAATFSEQRRITVWHEIWIALAEGEKDLGLPITDAQLSLHPIFSQSFAAELALFQSFSVLLHQGVYTSPMHGNHARLLDGEPVEIGFGANYWWSDALQFQLLAIDNVSPVEPASDFTVMLSMKLIGFLMLAVRHEAISQILGLLVLENGIFLGSQILVPGMPLLFELVILFDLLVIVACFGVLVGYLVTHVGTTSSLDLRRLVG